MVATVSVSHVFVETLVGSCCCFSGTEILLGQMPNVNMEELRADDAAAMVSPVVAVPWSS